MIHCVASALTPAWDEADRLSALHDLGILDTPPEPEFDGIAEIAGQVLQAPIALISFVEDKRQWFKAEVGLGLRETPLDASVCAHAIRHKGLFVVPDLSQDPRFSHLPTVEGAPHLRFYAGAVVETKNGLPLGTVCVVDYHPRPDGITEAQAKTLRTLARQVMIQLEHRQTLTAFIRHEAELAQSERKFRTLADTLPQMIWSTRPDGYHDYYNQRWYEFTGLLEGSVDGDGWSGIFHPDDQDRAWAAWRHALATGVVYEIEYRLRHHSGEYRWTLGRALPIRNQHGQIERWYGTCTDIHDQKTAEERLRDSEERYRALVDASATMVWRADAGGSIIEAWGWETFCGQDPEAHRGYGWLDAVHPDDRDRVIAKWQGYLASGEACEQEYRVRHIDGEYRWTLARGVPLRNANGAIQEWVGTLTDIDDQKRSGERLRESEERFRLLAEHATDIITRADLSGRRTYVSPAILEVTGYSPEELMGMTATDFCHPDDLAGVKAALAATACQGRASAIYRHRKKDGTWASVEASVKLVRSATGEPEALIGITRDISERQQLEAQLRQAQKMEAMGALTGGVAHDFNNLLTVILGNAELLAEALPDPAFQSLAKMIQDAAETASDLTQRLLAFGRRQSLALEPVKIDEVLGGMAGLLRRTIGEHIDLRTEFSGVGSTLADKSLLESAILNLVVNARDAMPQGGTLTIRTGEGVAGPKDGSLPAGQPVVIVTVEDTGTGISRDVLDRVFEPFFTTKDVGKGSGLGLSMVYGFAHQSGGHVRIESQPGHGTSVTILLRSVPAIADQPEDKTRPAAPVRSEGRVLLVEDEPSVRRFVRSQLESFGYVVTDVEDGRSALDLVKAGGSFDLLLTDVVLPKGLSGVEVAREAQTISPQIKVLLTSGYSEEAFEAHGRPDSDTPLLRKPFRRRDLADAVQEVLRSGSR